ncbi:MAG: NADH-quinone oxidoreductase subunit M [Bacteroidetes bacterium]|nr:NADH-quinone oxidoreductase subunit M [Bacteroidota bacterium]
MNLLLLLIVPLIAAIGIMLSPRVSAVRQISLAASLVQLMLVGWLLFQMLNSRSVSAQPLYFEQVYQWFPSWNIQFHIGVDGIAISMMILTALVVLAGVLVSWQESILPKEFFFLLMFLSLGAYGFFMARDIFTLFFFLELAVIPKFLLIGIWGSGQKQYSAMKLALMLMAGSALVFVGLTGIYLEAHSFDLTVLSATHFPVAFQYLFYPLLFVGFGIFAALFPFHTWVPDGHASAPTAASMFLAGISMKLGGYGCLRVASFLMPDAAIHYAPVIIILSTCAILYGAFVTLMQSDLKYMNAYSSVSHCGFVMLGIGVFNTTSVYGAILQMISHGLMTALFFAAIGMIYYRTHTRKIPELGGLLAKLPFISTVFVIAGLCSLGLPGLSGFVAEMTVFVGSWENKSLWVRLATILSCASIVVTAVYILRASGKVIMGPIRETFVNLSDAVWYEKMAAIFLLAGIFVMGIAPFLLQYIIGNEAAAIVKQGTQVLINK